ncbi:MAG: PBP1A family penicillin-binding protein [Syntrophomonas sp.]|nr:PBP1A family penicillin-binding protein [Syntrophomonas sp.]
MKNSLKFLMALGGLIIFVAFFYIGVTLTQTTPKVAQFFTGINSWEYRIQEQTVVYYSDQKVMGKLGYQRQYSEDFPKFLKDAVVAVEDRRFYQHSGFDAKSIGRAIYNDLKEGSKAQGASTITQQLARTVFLSNEKSYSRKIKELFIATAIEGKYTKEAILNMYLNEIYVGRGCSGMACAANSYFGKDLSALNKAEMTMLAGIIQSPEFYSPDRNLEGLKQRQQTVVDLLVEQGIISASEGQSIMKQKLNIKKFSQNPNNHPYYMTYLSALLEDMVGAQKLYGGGLKIYTTIDSRMQNAAEASVVNNANSFKNRGITAKDIALVSVDPVTGGIMAMVGGVSWERNQINMAISPRQPGSAIKPLYYAAALNEGIIKTDTVLNNSKRDFNGYSPDNYAASPDKVTVRDALVHSYNVASVEVLNKLGVEKAAKYLVDYGITTVDKQDQNLALALGGMIRGISPLQLASAYSIFPAAGRHEEPFTVIKIVDASKKIIYDDRSGSKQIIKSNSATTMDNILKAVVSEGTGSNARIALNSGGKTGTTEGRSGKKTSQDLWYVGYTSELVTAVWVGNSDNSEIKGLGTYGGTVAGPVWRDYMNSLINKSVFREKPFIPVVEEAPAEEPATPITPAPQEPGTVPGTLPQPNPTPAPGPNTVPTPAPVTPNTSDGKTQSPQNTIPPATTNLSQPVLPQ